MLLYDPPTDLYAKECPLGGSFYSWCVTTQALPTSLILVTPLKRERIRPRAQFLIKTKLGGIIT